MSGHLLANKTEVGLEAKPAEKSETETETEMRALMYSGCDCVKPSRM